MASVIITGGNAGIGYYMTRQFLEDGHCVAVLDVSTDRLEPLELEYDGSLVICAGDAADEADVARCLMKVKGLWGGVDIAIHNACVCVFASFDKTSEADLKRVHEVNFGGAVNLARWALPIMKRQKYGRLCFVSSGVGVTGMDGLSAYASSKGAIEALARCLRLECAGTGVSVHLLHPPLTRTASSSPLPVPPQVMAEPEKVGRALARRIESNSFVITTGIGQRLMVGLAYHLPGRIGGLMSSMTKRAKSSSAALRPAAERAKAKPSSKAEQSRSADN